ncbi:hypothetical protein [Photobacterium halotolerans]|uniref:hypothetical protein n=3 Tax=Photobacterium halotolerans TaxID=265726 RepID=UPI000411997E|nr:hypothetical protein [Photobacterium halotolerans]
MSSLCIERRGLLPGGRIVRAFTVGVLSPGALAAIVMSSAVYAADNDDAPDVYFTMGVHNDFGCQPASKCLPQRQAGDPSDPQYPEYWISDWTMFRVFQNYANNPPPYTNPPATLSPQDYTVSYGTTYYDSTYRPADGDGEGAMMEHYHKYCLPIFPIENNEYSCSFVSLGNKAYFLTYPEDRPADMPECCLFSPQNHPPRRDFIKHLPYSANRSALLNGSVQAYALTLQGPEPILFGYAFNKALSPDAATGEWYRHPQSFYFSGDSQTAKAPIVSQNYTSFRKQRPQAADTWDKVGQMCTAQPLPKCQLFTYQEQQDNKALQAVPAKRGAGVWSDLKAPRLRPSGD